MDENGGVSTFSFFMFLLVLIVLLVGEPDIHDAIIHWLMKP